MKLKRKALLFSLILLTACATKSGPQTQASGEEKTASTEVLETGAKMLQTNAPTAAMDVYLLGFHPMKEHPDHQMEAHHFCKQVNEDFAQCALFDGNTKDATLNGIEYIISETLFNALPDEEQKYWHPHNYEIFSGTLIAPGLPDVAEKELMEKKINSYGKTWHVWNTGHFGMNDKTTLPTGKPELAWSFNHDGEAVPGLVEKMEERFEIVIAQKREDRKDLVRFSHPQKGVNVLRKKYPRRLQSIEGVKER